MDFDFITQQMKDLGTSSVPSMQVVSPTHRHLPSWVPGIDFASLDSFHWIDHEAPRPPIPTGRSQGSICRLQVWKLIHLQHFYVGEPSPALTKEENPMQFFFQPQIPQRYLEMNVSLLIPTVSFVRWSPCVYVPRWESFVTWGSRLWNISWWKLKFGQLLRESL